MSRDRVHFKPSAQGTTHSSKERQALKQAISECFGLMPSKVEECMAENITIICRPSQFARFLIRRHELGGKNVFSCLEPRLVPAVDCAPQLDVSRNGNTVEC